MAPTKRLIVWDTCLLRLPGVQTVSQIRCELWQVTSMRGMFCNATAFNQPLNTFATVSVVAAGQKP